MAEMMTVQEAAKALNRRPKSVRDYIRDDALPCRRETRTGQILIDPAELTAWSNRPEIRAMFALGDARKGIARATA